MSDAIPSGVEIKPACPKPCSSCPWRLANQGSTPDPHRFYTKANLARLWKGLRDGARMSCHPTDPRMAEFAGFESLAERVTTHECTGALVLVQREFMKYQEIALGRPNGMRDYQRENPKGLKRYGLIAIVERAVLGGSMLDRHVMARPDLGDIEIGYPVLSDAKLLESFK